MSYCFALFTLFACNSIIFHHHHMCVSFFEKKQNAHIYFHSEQRQQQHAKHTLSSALSSSSSPKIVAAAAASFFFCSLSLSSQSRRRRRSFSLLACVGCRVAHIFFKSKNPQRATRGNRKRQKRRRREERIHQRRRTGREKKNFEKKKIQLCCSDERERIFIFNQPNFFRDRTTCRGRAKFVSLGRSHAVCALFLKKKTERENEREYLPHHPILPNYLIRIDC